MLFSFFQSKVLGVPPSREGLGRRALKADRVGSSPGTMYGFGG